jgi:hypothetical protein
MRVTVSFTCDHTHAAAAPAASPSNCQQFQCPPCLWRLCHIVLQIESSWFMLSSLLSNLCLSTATLRMFM